MSREGYDAFDDPYTYKGTTVLKNRIGFREPETLAAFEVLTNRVDVVFKKWQQHNGRVDQRGG